MRSSSVPAQRVGITTVYVTHDQSEAMVMSDRIVVMFDGVASHGAPPTIYGRPASRQVANSSACPTSFPAASPRGERRAAASRRRRRCNACAAALGARKRRAAGVPPEAVALSIERPSDAINLFGQGASATISATTDTA
jgi:ABC-type Fe3+/spermidine/putrescine transport system ATPase subunit